MARAEQKGSVPLTVLNIRPSLIDESFVLVRMFTPRSKRHLQTKKPSSTLATHSETSLSLHMLMLKTVGCQDNPLTCSLGSWLVRRTQSTHRPKCTLTSLCTRYLYSKLDRWQRTRSSARASSKTKAFMTIERYIALSMSMTIIGCSWLRILDWGRFISMIPWMRSGLSMVQEWWSCLSISISKFAIGSSWFCSRWSNQMIRRVVSSFVCTSRVSVSASPQRTGHPSLNVASLSPRRWQQEGSESQNRQRYFPLTLDSTHSVNTNSSRFPILLTQKHAFYIRELTGTKLKEVDMNVQSK